MNRIIVIRHAESIANSKGIYQGQTYDTALSALGKKQAKALGKTFANRKVDKIIASPLKRTRETASEIVKVTNCELSVNEQIIETNHGKWEGKNKNWITKNYPDEIKTWNVYPSKAKFSDGESFTETIIRTKNFITDTKWQGTTVVVTHDNIIRIMLSLAKNISIDKMWEFKLEPAAVTEFRVTTNGKNVLKLISSNDTRHLKEFRSNLSNHAL